MRSPTAAQLRDAVRNPNPDLSSYEGGFTTGDGGAHFLGRTDGDGTVDFHVQLSGAGFGNASLYHRLTVEESRELRLMLEQVERAAGAAENYQERNT